MKREDRMSVMSMMSGMSMMAERIVASATRQRRALWPALALCVWGASACGNSAKPDEDPSEARPPQLAGRYVSACTPQPQADGSTSYFKLDFDLTATRWTLDYVVFADEACATKALTVNIRGPYELTAPSSQVEGAWEGRFGFDAKTMTPHAQFMVDMLAGIQGCGAGGWTLDQATDVSGGCAPFGQYPLSQCGADYDVVKLNEGSVQFGQRPANNDMCEPGKRPTALSPLLNVKQ